MTIVKPIIATKVLVKKAAKGGEVLTRRLSPKRGRLLDLFDEMVHFTNVFPHRGLTLEVLLVEVEESRYPGHGRRRRWRENDHEVEDQRLVAIHGKHRLRTAADLARLVRCPLPSPFHTAHLAESLGVRRWSAQRIVYCLQRMGSLRLVGKDGNTRLYQFAMSNVCENAKDKPGVELGLNPVVGMGPKRLSEKLGKRAVGCGSERSRRPTNFRIFSGGSASAARLHPTAFPISSSW